VGSDPRLDAGADLDTFGEPTSQHADLETSFLPGRTFASPADFNLQLAEWLDRANARTVRSIQGRPVDLLETDYLSMIPLPPIDPPMGLNQRVRLDRDYYVRVDTVDYSVDPPSIGRFVDVTASPQEVTVLCDGHAVALRALPDYDALFGVDFDPSSTRASNE